MNRISDWYWEHGIKRTGEHEIKIGDWVFPMMDMAQRKEAAISALQSRSAIGLWGPSRSGKSVLLSRYLNGVNEDGMDSALSWDGGIPCLFSWNGPTATLCLNPDTTGSDGSAVVARYTALDQKDIHDPMFPVRLSIASPFQWLYAFAIGYLELCQHRIIAYDSMQIKDLLAREEEDFNENALPDPQACETLACLSEIISAFIEAGKTRFVNLGSDDEWNRHLRKQMLNNKGLNRSKRNAERFMAELLWNNEGTINDGISKVRYFLETTVREWGDKPIYCSLEVAQLLLNFRTLNMCQTAQGINEPQGPDQERGLNTLNRVRRIKWLDNGQAIHIGFFEGGQQIGLEKFGVLQTLTSELQIPIRQDRIHNNDFLNLIRSYDLIDIPGVSLETGDDANSNKYNFSQETPEKNERFLFTEISKLGRTLSLVYSNSKSLTIDAFLIIMRNSAGGHVYDVNKGYVIQLGLQKWWSELGYHSEHDAPLFLNLTFIDCGLRAVYRGADTLGWLIQNSVRPIPFARKHGNVRLFLTYYPWLGREYTLEGIDQNNLYTQARNDKVFQDYVEEWESNLDDVFEVCGVDYMLRNITSSLDREKRRNKIKELLRRDREQMINLVTPKLPSDSDRDVDLKRRIIQEVIGYLQQVNYVSKGLTTNEIATFLKEMMYVDPETLDPLPINVQSGNFRPFAEFQKKQFDIWIKNKVEQFDEGNRVWNYLFNQNGNGMQEFRLFLRTMEEGVEKEQLFDWLVQTMQNFHNRNVAKRVRSLYALGMSNLLWTGSYIRKRQEVITPQVIENRLGVFRKIQLEEEYENTIAKLRILDPFVQQCQNLANGNIRQTVRRPQPGDNELAQILDKIKNEPLLP